MSFVQMTSQVGFLSFNSQEPRDGGDDDVDCSAVLIRQNSSSLSAGSIYKPCVVLWMEDWRNEGRAISSRRVFSWQVALYLTDFVLRCGLSHPV